MERDTNQMSSTLPSVISSAQELITNLETIVSKEVHKVDSIASKPELDFLFVKMADIESDVQLRQNTQNNAILPQNQLTEEDMSQSGIDLVYILFVFLLID